MTFNILNREIIIKRDAVIAAVIFLAVLLAIAGYAVVRKDDDITIYSSNEKGTGTSDNLPSGNSKDDKASKDIKDDKEDNEDKEDKDYNNVKEDEEIKVYVIGCVKKPGIVTLKKGQLVDDAVKAAGGFSEDADIYNINLVYSLNENTMIRIKPKSNAVEEDNNVKGGTEVKEGKGGEAGKGIDILRDSGSYAVISGKDEKKAGGKVNINTASAAELDTLPGIGAATANDIIAYREVNGKFTTIKDIMKVPRIKESRFNSIKDFITVD